MHSYSEPENTALPGNNSESHGIQIIGPFQKEYKVTCDGYRVPYLTAQVSKAPTGEITNYYLSLDERFGCDVPPAYLNQFVWFLANAMAVAAGYSSHGENCQPINPYKVKMTGGI